VAIAAILFAAARSCGRFRLCLEQADGYAWLKSREPWAKGMVLGTTERERQVVELSRERADYYRRQEARFRRAAWRFWEPFPLSDPPGM
jgi:hypothetical protein